MAEAEEGDQPRVQDDRKDGVVCGGGDGVRGGPADEPHDRGEEQGAPRLGLHLRDVHPRAGVEKDRLQDTGGALEIVPSFSLRRGRGAERVVW